jgi:hypothetical protein
MRAIVIAFALALTFSGLPAVAQEWRDVGTATAGEHIRVRMATMPSPNNAAWIIMDSSETYDAPRTLDDGRSFTAVLYHNEFRCSERLERIASQIYFADAELQHEVQWVRVFSPWHAPTPGLSGEAFFRAACGT